MTSRSTGGWVLKPPQDECATQTELRINKKKTEVLRLNSKCNTRIQIDNQHLNEVAKNMLISGLLLTSKEVVKKT